MEKNNSGHLKDSEGINCIQVSTSSGISLESGEKVNIDPSFKHSEENAEEAEKHGQICGGERDRNEVGVKAAIASEHDSRIGFNSTPEEDESGETSLFLNESDIPNELHENQIGCSSNCNITQGGKSANSDVALATEDPERASIEDIVKNILGIAGASTAVNFETPILDVEFISRNIADTKLFLDDLLFDKKEPNSVDPSVKDSGDDLPTKEQLESTDDLSVQEHHDLVLVDDGNSGHYSVDNDYCYALIDVPVHVEGDNLP
ncbi:hypothetical protein L6164_017965 [Bauhinia variegata]|nr:hypothetical protein L6164_017965 [Bauhinia variegata]